MKTKHQIWWGQEGAEVIIRVVTIDDPRYSTLTGGLHLAHEFNADPRDPTYAQHVCRRWTRTVNLNNAPKATTRVEDMPVNVNAPATTISGAFSILVKDRDDAPGPSAVLIFDKDATPEEWAQRWPGRRVAHKFHAESEEAALRECDRWVQENSGWYRPGEGVPQMRTLSSEVGISTTYGAAAIIDEGEEQ